MPHCWPPRPERTPAPTASSSSASTQDVQPPASRVRISEVRIYWADSQGAELGANVYNRIGSTSCTMPDDTTVTVPYTLDAEQ